MTSPAELRQPLLSFRFSLSVPKLRSPFSYRTGLATFPGCEIHLFSQLPFQRLTRVNNPSRIHRTLLRPR